MPFVGADVTIGLEVDEDDLGMREVIAQEAVGNPAGCGGGGVGKDGSLSRAREALVQILLVGIEKLRRTVCRKGIGFAVKTMLREERAKILRNNGIWA